MFQLPLEIEPPELPSEPRFPAPPLPPVAESNSFKMVEHVSLYVSSLRVVQTPPPVPPAASAAASQA